MRILSRNAVEIVGVALFPLTDENVISFVVPALIKGQVGVVSYVFICNITFVGFIALTR